LQALEEKDILEMQIDPGNVTVNDIKRYERLMSGKSVGARSNATSLLGKVVGVNGTNFFTKHHW
jgi:hypothetical protein